MTQQTRRTFLASATALTLATTSGFAMQKEKEKKILAHHVFFWLKNPGSTADRDKLIEGLKGLAKIETIRAIHIGMPADTEKRPVVENSYHVSELMFFDDLAGQKTYQDHPLHKAFVENCSSLWEKVVVFDSLDV